MATEVRKSQFVGYERRMVLVDHELMVPGTGQVQKTKREVWIDVPKAAEPLPEGTPIFANIADDEAVLAALEQYNRLREQIGIAEEAAKIADEEYGKVLQAYGAGDATMPQVEAAHARAETMRARIPIAKSSIAGATLAVVEARKAAISRGTAEWAAATQPLYDEYLALHARLRELDVFFADTRRSFSRTSGHPLRSFLPTRMQDSPVTSRGSVESAIDRYAWQGLEAPEPARITENTYIDNRQKPWPRSA